MLPCAGPNFKYPILIPRTITIYLMYCISEENCLINDVLMATYIYELIALSYVSFVSWSPLALVKFI